MHDNMVRTQVYLPREVHTTLTERAEQHGLTLAAQIRAALAEYLARAEAEAEGVRLAAADPLFQMLGQVDSGVADLGRSHDHYLYGAPRPAAERQAPKRAAEPKARYQPRRPARARKKRA